MATTRKITKYIGWVVTAMLLFMIAKKLYNDYQNKNEIEANLAATEGEIIDYYIVGTDSPYLTYKYEVDSQEYEETTSVFAAFMGCEKTKECLGRRFVVYYSKKNPEKSEIDLDKEIE